MYQPNRLNHFTSVLLYSKIWTHVKLAIKFKGQTSKILLHNRAENLQRVTKYGISLETYDNSDELTEKLLKMYDTKTIQ